jgi:UDP-glucose 4-epimerase
VLRARRVLVTGGVGFVGSHLVRRLLGLGYEVTVLDYLSGGNVEYLADVSGRVLFVRGDVRNSGAVSEALMGVDVVFHLAALTDVLESFRKPMLYMDVNVGGTVNLLRCCVEDGVKRFVYVSSCAVYGDPVRLPIDEGHPTNPLSPYGASKLAAEAYCGVYSKAYELETLVFRLFNVYGPRQSRAYAGVVAEFIKRVKRGEPPVIFGDGEQTRDFIFVYDVAEFLVKALEYQPENVMEVMNVGSGKPTTMNDLAKLVLKMGGRCDLKPIFEKPRSGEIRFSVAETSKAVKLLGYAPQYTMEEGLKMTIDAM